MCRHRCNQSKGREKFVEVLEFHMEGLIKGEQTIPMPHTFSIYLEIQVVS
jgi:hypothetical protein